MHNFVFLVFWTFYFFYVAFDLILFHFSCYKLFEITEDIAYRSASDNNASNLALFSSLPGSTC